MKSKTTQYNVDIIKRVNLGHLPLFVQFAHKGLEKAVPDGTKTSDGGTAFVVPKDILKLSVSNPIILDSVESIEFVYKDSK